VDIGTIWGNAEYSMNMGRVFRLDGKGKSSEQPSVEIRRFLEVRLVFDQALSTILEE